MPASDRPIRVLIADDHAIVREGLAMLLSAFDDIDVVAFAEHGTQALDRCGEARPDVVLMDLSMPVLDGIEATRRILAEHPSVRVLALTSFLEPQLVRDVLEAGATGYLLKSVTSDELVGAVRAAAGDRPTIDPEALPLLFRKDAGPVLGDDLTARERDVLGLIVRGMTNKQIATDLVLSVGTIRVYVSNVLVKLGAANRTEAATLALRHQLVPEPG
ncbi:MAG: response regulator transcription factor [Acidimicrobiia bacterium]|nr:response regulator transcription factor [Acidimicrobiia bacterium]